MSQLITIRSGVAGFNGLKQVRESLKLSLRALMHRQATGGWLQLLNSHPLFMELVKARPRLLYKIYRPYLSNTMGCAERVDLLQQHYRFIFRQGLGPLTVRAARGSVVLGGIEGKSGLPYQIRLSAIEPMEREGELVLQLYQDDGLVYSCAFSFQQGVRGMVLSVGCMQGSKSELGLQRIKDATRELHGLRPTNMMVKLLGQIGHDYGCAELRLVSNANRVVCGATRQGKVHADYDTLWQELDAGRRADGDWRLPCEAIAPPDLAAIASKKRSEARKRHETLLALSAVIRAGLSAPRFETVPTPLSQNYSTLTVAAHDGDEYALA
ncbi:DUF535 domain-containing protein [Duganella sp. BJB488]|uniref:VirK/YbjX family protein n=1 Tax=unclassified Duganella TaxID=2636909 RepID=UPI000E34DCDE|nr:MULTISPECIES: VirK/YbjX family protein [unclassified Duganella]RFP26172.1 DUF535 domain-containing protein [Duganella sp. BJB489]RFP28088.1 DUF535 domain-containing protein [Duganella sp. BJB488]RFP37100.1 DUF535 domain-containing protein [Duganella sp. BJB480]